MRRSRMATGVVALALVLIPAACGLRPLREDQLPDPSRHGARVAAFTICSRAADRYGLQRMARYLGASSEGPRAVARAFVREAVRLTDGWEPYRAVAVRGCLAGIGG